MPNYIRISNLNESNKINNLKENSVYCYTINIKGYNIELPIFYYIIKRYIYSFYYKIIKLSECIKNDKIECKTSKNYIGRHIKSFILIHDGIASLDMNSIYVRDMIFASKQIGIIKKYCI